MNIKVNKLPKSTVEIEVELPMEEAKPYLETAVRELSEKKPLDGFRPGNVPFDVALKQYGEMTVLETAMPTIVRKTYLQAVKDNELKPFGEPDINVIKLAPDNPIVFKATIAVVPAVTKLADWKNIKVKPEVKATTDADVDKALKELQKMRTKEAATDREVREKDKVVVDIDMSLEGVPLEGGQARDHGIYLDEEYYIPGLKNQMLGLKTGEKKSFKLKFPAEHYQKHLASKEVDFAVTIKQIYELSHPDLDEEFAKGLGQKSIDDLKALLKQNMEKEETDKAQRTAENKIIETIVEKSRYEEVPDVIINREIDRMIHELEHSVEDRGLKFDDYLANLKKSLGDLKLEMTPQALKRVHSALVINNIGEEEKVEVSESEALAEQQRLLNAYAHDAKAQEQIRSADYLDYLMTALRNNKIVDLIRKTCMEEK